MVSQASILSRGYRLVSSWLFAWVMIPYLRYHAFARVPLLVVDLPAKRRRSQGASPRSGNTNR